MAGIRGFKPVPEEDRQKPDRPESVPCPFKYSL